MAYLHGIRIEEAPTKIPAPIKNEAGVPVVFGTAPVNLAAKPTVNELVLCNTFAEARAALGYSGDYESYSLCQAMDAFFKAFATGPVVFCNVIDPETNVKEYTETIAVTEGQATGTSLGVFLDDRLAVTGTDPLVKETDYTVEFNEEGYPVFTVIKPGVSSISVTGKMIDTGTVTTADIIGSYDSETGVATGIELIRRVYPKFSKAPSLLLAPGWSDKPAVAHAMAEKCEELNGTFKSECVVDLDTTTATNLTEAIEQKIENGYLNPHMIALWPMVKYSGKIMAYSAIYAAMACHTDAENDNVPSLSPSNKPIKVSALVLKDGTEVNLDQPEANELNGAGIVTALNFTGSFRAWGNNTCAYPETIDPKDRWIACRRFFTWWGNSFIINYWDKVDDPMSYRLIESIVDAENIRGNSLVSTGKCAGARMEYRKEENPIQSILDGKIVFHQYLAPYVPAEDILNVLEFDPSMLEAELSGGE